MKAMCPFGDWRVISKIYLGLKRMGQTKLVLIVCPVKQIKGLVQNYCNYLRFYNKIQLFAPNPRNADSMLHKLKTCLCQKTTVD